MTSYNRTLKEEVLSFYRAKNITIPVDIVNVLDDIFEEITFDEEVPNSVNCYTVNDIDNLKNDIDVHTYLNISVGGLSNGNVTRKFTYYGELPVHYSEEIILTDVDNTVTQISKISGNKTEVNPKDWLIVVIEEIKFKEGKSEVHQRMYIYGPSKLEENRYAGL